MLTKTDLKHIRGVVGLEVRPLIKGSEMRIKKEIIKEVIKVQKKLEDMDNFLDTELMEDRKRIVRIEEHLGFSEN